MEEYTIGQFSKMLGVNKETVRYYENLGLFPLPEKKKNGYKIYTKQHVELMEIILLIKDSGFTLKETKNLITIQEDDRNSQNILYKDIIFKKIELIEKKIRDLDSLKKGLEKVVYDIDNYNIRSCIEIKRKDKNCID
jgi:DNA-binding transcriptional MerR regulator